MGHPSTRRRGRPRNWCAGAGSPPAPPETLVAPERASGCAQPFHSPPLQPGWPPPEQSGRPGRRVLGRRRGTGGCRLRVHPGMRLPGSLDSGRCVPCASSAGSRWQLPRPRQPRSSPSVPFDPRVGYGRGLGWSKVRTQTPTVTGCMVWLTPATVSSVN
jgi:hypothetical protein